MLRSFTRMCLLCSALAIGTATSPSVFAADVTGIEELCAKLRSDDFRVAVQAALILGKTGDGKALQPLTSALEDKSVAVRAAAAAALNTLGDPAALPALRRAASDSNAAVARRIAATITALESTQKEQLVARRSATILVKLDGFEGRSVDGRSGASAIEALGAAALASRKMLGDMPQVALLNPSEEPEVAAARHKRPVVVMRPSLRKLASSKDGSDTVVSVNVEFLIEALPEYNIVGRFSGNASAKSLAESAAARSELQEEAVGAAVASALRRGGPALLAVAQRS